MIPVVRPADAPPVLLKKGADATRKLCNEYVVAPRDYVSGARSFGFDSSIYGAREVKAALRDAQHRKCAFCESNFDHTGYGDIEQIRPKAGYKQRETDELKRPGYYWLAYEWNNLFYACQLCNQRFKRNLFPLKDGRRRARSHTHDLSKEEPLLVDPCARDPSAYVGFREEYAYAVGGCREGEVTIEVLGLNREELLEVRRRRLKILKFLVSLRDRLRKEIATAPTPERSEDLREVEEILRASREDGGEYAAMARAFLDRSAPAGAGG
jgi:uncharacterized protein (TIGR02646 family)